MKNVNVKELITEAVKGSGSAIKAMLVNFRCEVSSDKDFQPNFVKIKCSSSEAERKFELDKLNIEFTEEHRDDELDFYIWGTIYLEDNSHMLIDLNFYESYLDKPKQYIKVNHIKQIEIPNELI